jgi:hypothetical protein
MTNEIQSEQRHLAAEAQVEQHESLSRDIKSNLTLASTSTMYQVRRLEKRGEQNVPVRYLKQAWWGTEEGDTGYFVTIEGHHLPIEFNHEHTYWEDVGYSDQESCWITDRVLGKQQGLEINPDEIVDRNEVGPINGQEAEDSNSG